MGSLMTMSVNRRSEYFARLAPSISQDPLTYYTRVMNGLKIQARFPWIKS